MKRKIEKTELQKMAKARANKVFPCDDELDFNRTAELAYQEGALDIIEKACEWLIAHTTYPYTDKGNISKKKLNEFRKAMERHADRKKRA